MVSTARHIEQTSSTTRLATRDWLECALRTLYVALLCGLITCLLANTAAAQSDVINREHTLKALFIYNFGSYIEWPPAAFNGHEHDFVIGVLGSSPVESTLREISRSKTIGGRRIVIRRFGSPELVQPCQILFVADDVGPTEQQAAIQQLGNAHVLIVGESPGFAQRGAVVNFFIEANKIRFEINVDTARQRGLKISAKLLSLARILGQGSPANR